MKLTDFNQARYLTLQVRYADARNAHETTKDRYNDKAVEFLEASDHIKPEEISNEDVYVAFCKEFEEVYPDIADELERAKERLRAAEDDLIDFGLTLVPEDVREQLQKGRKAWNIREKIVKALYKLEN